jgi:ADP-heptose:LPS heptosyltransferase
MFFKQIEKKGKSWLISFCGLFLKRKKLTKEMVDISTIRKILLVRQDERMGNLILTTPLLLSLREAFPQAQIFYLAHSTFASIFSHSGLIDQIIISQKRKYINNPGALISLVRKLKKEKFDLAFDLSDENNFSFNNSFLTYLSDAKFRLGHEHKSRSIFLNLSVPLPKEKRHVSEMHLDLLAYLIGPMAAVEPKVSVSQENQKEIQVYLQGKGIKDNEVVIGINLGGEGERRWEWENYFALAEWIVNELKYKVVLIWGPSEKELIKDIPEQIKKRVILAELFPLPVLAALLQRFKLLVSCDTGPMHLAVAVGTPILAIFSASDKDKFGPKGEKHRVVFSSSGKVSVEMVKEALLEMLKKIKNHNIPQNSLANQPRQLGKI